jgi:hypothetical protein
MREPLFGRYALKWATIPNQLFNINETNNTFRFFADGKTGVPTQKITPGTYTGTTLATYLQSLFTTYAGYTVTVTYSATSNALTITPDAPHYIRLSFAQAAFTETDGTYAGTFFDTGAMNAWTTLGFTIDSAFYVGTFAGASLSVTSGPIALFTPASVGIRIRESPDAGYTSVATQSTGTLIVPLPITTTASYNFTSSDVFDQSFTIPHATKSINIRVVQPGTGLDQTLNNAEWEMLIEHELEPETQLGSGRPEKRQRTDMGIPYLDRGVRN